MLHSKVAVHKQDSELWHLGFLLAEYYTINLPLWPVCPSPSQKFNCADFCSSRTRTRGFRFHNEVWFGSSLAQLPNSRRERDCLHQQRVQNSRHRVHNGLAAVL